MAYQNWLCFDNAGHAQTISDFFTAHRTRNTLAARLRFPFFWEEPVFSISIICIACIFCQKRETNDLKKHFHNEKRNAGYPTVAKPKRFKTKNNMCFVVVHFFLFLFTCCSLLSFLFISCHFFSFLFMSFHFFLFLFISFHFLHFPSLEKNITNPDHLHVDPLLSFAMFCWCTVHLLYYVHNQRSRWIKAGLEFRPNKHGFPIQIILRALTFPQNKSLSLTASVKSSILSWTCSMFSPFLCGKWMKMAPHGTMPFHPPGRRSSRQETTTDAMTYSLDMTKSQALSRSGMGRSLEWDIYGQRYVTSNIMGDIVNNLHNI